MAILMKYATENIEIKVKISLEPGSSNNITCPLKESVLVKLSDGTSIKVPKGFIIHNTDLIDYEKISIVHYINDLDDFSTTDNEEITIKLKIEVPHGLLKFVRKKFTKITAVPYFKCECLADGKTKMVVIYTKERFERNDKMWERYKKLSAESLPNGKYGIINSFCPYYGNCNLDSHQKVYLSKNGKELSQIEMDMIQIQNMIV